MMGLGVGGNCPSIGWKDEVTKIWNDGMMEGFGFDRLAFVIPFCTRILHFFSWTLYLGRHIRLALKGAGGKHQTVLYNAHIFLLRLGLAKFKIFLSRRPAPFSEVDGHPDRP
jgi:hypothetical protein